MIGAKKSGVGFGIGLGLGLWLTTAMAADVAAQSAPAGGGFYAGKTVSVFIGATPGGVNDVWARVIARHLPQNLHGAPAAISKNMPGAGGRKLAFYLETQAPKDGSEFGVVNRSLFTEALLRTDNQDVVDFSKLTAVGSPGPETLTCVSWHSAPVQSLDDMKRMPFIIGATGGGSAAGEVLAANIVNAYLGTQIKAIGGYPGGSEMSLAMQRGETHGRCAMGWAGIKVSSLAMVESKEMKILLQTALEAHPDLPDVPVLYDMVQGETEKQALYLLLVDQKVGRPFIAPPGLPPGRAAELRQGFLDTLNDPAFRAEADKLKLEVAPIPGAEIDAMLARLSQTTPAALEHARKVAAY